VSVTAGGAANAAAKSAELRNQPGAYAGIFEPEGRPCWRASACASLPLPRRSNGWPRKGWTAYRGDLAVDIASDLAMLGSPVSAADLAAHHAAETEPLSVQVKGATLFNHQPRRRASPAC
jgi:gamma-glutamyltranspeptidase/glutathione hydrolase